LTTSIAGRLYQQVRQTVINQHGFNLAWIEHLPSSSAVYIWRLGDGDVLTGIAAGGLRTSAPSYLDLGGL
jgi:hypothetical protein